MKLKKNYNNTECKRIYRDIQKNQPERIMKTKLSIIWLWIIVSGLFAGKHYRKVNIS